MSQALSTKHIPELDGLRGIAVLFVMYAHLHNVRLVIDFGHLGVLLFFVLSGFLISGILFDRHGEDSYLKNFWGRRILRIFPLYYALLFILFVVLPQIAPDSLHAFHQETTKQWWYWLYLQNFRKFMMELPDFHLVNHLWTLAIEEQFYLLWPFVIAFMPMKRVRYVCWGLVALGLVSRGIHYYYIERSWAWSHCAPWSSFDAMALGCLLAIHLREGGLKSENYRKIIYSLIGLSAVFVASLVYLKFGTFSDQSHAYLNVERGLGIFISVLVIAVLLVAPTDNWFRRLNRWSPLRTCGKYSYGIYILHPFVYFLVEAIVKRVWHVDPMETTEIVPRAVFICVSIVASFFAAWLSWHLLEKHFLKLKRHFAFKTPSATKMG